MAHVMSFQSLYILSLPAHTEATSDARRTVTMGSEAAKSVFEFLDLAFVFYTNSFCRLAWSTTIAGSLSFPSVHGTGQ